MEVFFNGIGNLSGLLYIKIFLRFLQGLFLFCLAFPAAGQTGPQFSDPELQLIKGKLQISYNILNSNANENFSVWIEVINSNGELIKPHSLSGDIGDVIGGDNKMIIWDLIADKISEDQGIYVQIIGEKFHPSGITDQTKNISRMGAVLRSAAFPGWGLSKIHPGKPHWIKGIAGYGCLTGSLIYNQKAATSYQNYLDSYDSQERVAFYDDWGLENTISTVLAYTALGIWLADIVWTILDSGELSNKMGISRIEGFSIGTDYEKSANAPMLTLSYKF